MIRLTELNRRSRTLTRGLVLAGGLVLAATGAAADARGCYRAEVAGTIVLPDGSEHAPGALRICTDRALSPVSNLHRLEIDGQPVGMFVSTRRGVEQSVDGSAALYYFKRDAANRLNLVGYIAIFHDESTLFEMAPLAIAHEPADGLGTVTLVAASR